MPYSPHMLDSLPTIARKKTIAWAIKCLQHTPELVFDTIVVSGSSGLLVGPAIADKLDKKLAIVRKRDEKSHADFNVEVEGYIGRYIIVDDFIQYGITARYMIQQIQQHNPLAKGVGVFLYVRGPKNVEEQVAEQERIGYNVPVLRTFRPVLNEPFRVRAERIDGYVAIPT